MGRRTAAIALAIAAGWAADVHAQTTVGVHLASLHAPAREHNNINPGVYVRSEAGWMAGAYYNSQRRMTVYAGREWALGGPWAVQTALATGYTYAPIVPVVGLTYSIGGGWRVTALPPTPKSSSLVHLTWETKL